MILTVFCRTCYVENYVEIHKVSCYFLDASLNGKISVICSNTLLQVDVSEIGQ